MLIDPRSTWFRDGDENDRICPWSWFALNHCDGPRTVDFVLEGITDFAFSIWTVGYLILFIGPLIVHPIMPCMHNVSIPCTNWTSTKLPKIIRLWGFYHWKLWKAPSYDYHTMIHCVLDVQSNRPQVKSTSKWKSNRPQFFFFFK